jgi:cytoskeletal protein RodZ
MALTGELSDLSLAELIEFFCNQRKTGRLKVIYSIGPGYFYLQSGSVVHARIGTLRGIEAVYYALTLPNASFTFSPAFEAPEHTINQPWTSVVLEGLRRMDEGVAPGNAFPVGHQAQVEEPEGAKENPATVSSVLEAAEEEPQSIPVHIPEPKKQPVIIPAAELPEMGAFFSQTNSPSRFSSWKPGAVLAAVALIVGVIAVPWGWYARSKAAKLANEAQTTPAATQSASQPVQQPEATSQTSTDPVSESAVSQTAAETPDLAARRLRDARAKERAKALETSAIVAPAQSSPAAVSPGVPKTQSSPVSGSKKATVQVTFDENGRVTQASGGDATALRIARQKRFPPGKAGSATITIPIN